MGENILSGLHIQMVQFKLFLLFCFYGFNIVFEDKPSAVLILNHLTHVLKQVNQFNQFIQVLSSLGQAECCGPLYTAGLTIRNGHKHIICRETKRATTDRRARMKSSRQGTSTGTWVKAPIFVFW